ncbi:MAG: hypothetical protein Q8P41_23205 [Pseudomonadota bacterium]|nr:hypothetical protein [Pseudomonadota bacterium]
MDSNDFNLTSAQITSMSYIEGSFVITEGQSGSPPPKFTKNGSTWTINIQANRSNSAPVAQSYNTKTGGATHEYTNASGDKRPTELNFYFGVNVTFLVSGASVVVPVYLGQGHYGTSNNWWFGGNTVINTGDPLLHVVSGGTILETLRITGSGSYSMTLTQVD